MIIFVKCSNGDKHSIRLSGLDLKVVDFKILLANASHLPSKEHILLTYKETPLEDEQTLISYGIREYATIDMKVPDDPLSDTDANTRTVTPDLYLVISQMMRALLLSPQLLNQIVDEDPQLRNSIAQLSKMLKDPEAVSVVRRLTSAPVMQQMLSSPFLPENHQYPFGILPRGVTAVPLETLYEAQLSYLRDTRDPDT